MHLRSFSNLLRTAVAAAVLLPGPISSLTPAASAQSEAGRAAITGRVADQTGAVVPGAKLEILATQTGEKHTLTSDAAGLYLAPALPVGQYSITVTAPNFSQSKIENVDLAIGQTAEINILLKPASVANTVTVLASDETDLTHVGETQNATVLNNEVVENLPTRGRNFTDFALLTPGISQEIDRFGLVVNGQRSGNSNISIDGMDFNDPLQNGQRGGSVSVYFYPQVAVREFQVVRTGADVSTGRTNAGFVNVVTKSGTNRFHGEALYTNRNPWLTWPDALNDPEATNNQNQFGAGIGGPIIKDKLFFFAGIEKTWFQIPFFVRNTNCPLTGFYDQNAGSFNSSGVFVPNPGFSQDLGCAQPAPNTGTPLPAAYAALETTSYGFNSPLVSSARLDYQINSRNTAMMQYLSTFLSNVAFGISGISTAAASNNTSYSQQSQAVILGLTTSLSSNRSNDAHIQWVYDNRLQQPDTPGQAEIDIGDFINIGGTATGTYVYRALREEAVDSYSWLLGKHSLRFGVDINLEPETQQRESFPNGLWTVDTFQDYLAALPKAQGGGGMSPAAINASAGSGCGATSNACPFEFQQSLPYSNGAQPRYIATQHEFAGFVSDHFRPFDRLTLDLGLRYEAQLEPAAPVNPSVPGTGVDPSDVTMFQPRLGVAWNVQGNGKTVIRASSGLFDARTPGYLLQHIFTDNGQFVANINSNYDQTILSQVTPYSSFGSFSGVKTSNILNDIYVNNSAFRNPRSLQAALAVERQFTRRTAFVFQFTNQETWKLQHRLDTNLFQPTVDPSTLYPIFPSTNPVTGLKCQYGGVAVPCRPNATIAGFHQNYSTAHSTYRSLIVQFKGSPVKNVMLSANYTWASIRDDDSNERDADRELALDPLCVSCFDKGYSKQDIRDNFNLHGVYHMPHRFIFSTSFIARTALPYTAVTSGSKQGDFNNDGNTKNDRPILCSQKAFTVCPVSSTQVNAYKGGAEVGTVVGRNTFRQDGFLNWDMRLIKEIRFREGKQLQFSAECLNCSRSSNLNLGANAVSKFTHAQTTMNPLTGYYYSGATAGLMTNAYDTFRSGGPRQIQLGTRFLF